MSRMPPGHVHKQPLVESMALGDLLRRLQHTHEGESKGKAADCKELRKNVHEECGPLQMKGFWTWLIKSLKTDIRFLNVCQKTLIP